MSSVNGSADRRRERLLELDLLRFLAAVAVLMYHATGGGTQDWQRNGVVRPFPYLSAVTHWGYLGVELFFMISGFVILMSAWGTRPETFAVSRFARLFPAYWFSLLASVALFFATRQAVDYGPGGEGVLRRFLPNLTMFQDAVGSRGMELSYWTLWVELRFYLLIGVLLWWGLTVRRVLGFMGAWLVASVMTQEAHSALLREILQPDWAPYFIAGMAFFLIHRYRGNLVCWLLIGFCWALATYYATQRIDPINRWPGVQNVVVPAVVTGLFALMALVATRRLGFLRWRVLAVAGTLTYPMYLMHEMVMRVAIHYLHARLAPWAVLAIAVGVIVAVSHLVHRLVERPGQRWMRARLAWALADLGRGDRSTARAHETAAGSADAVADRTAIGRTATPAAKETAAVTKPAGDRS